MSEQMSEAVQEGVKKFSLSEYVQGKATVPTDSVTVYTDAETAYLIDKTKEENDAAVRSGGLRSIADSADIDVRLEELQTKVEQSALVIHMRAVGEAERDVIIRQVRRAHPIPKNSTEEETAAINEERQQEVTFRWIAASIVKIVTNDGEVDDSKQTLDSVAMLHQFLYRSEWNKIMALFERLCFSDSLFDRAVDAGFRGGAPVAD